MDVSARYNIIVYLLLGNLNWVSAYAPHDNSYNKTMLLFRVEQTLISVKVIIRPIQ